ncbi:hypothetical protein [Streptomyces jumonjinensis]|uniref:hypothetical protein n=1 Tax=Streptomyces jumonjinensis TaxID=1945 RepID=UPI0037AEB948
MTRDSLLTAAPPGHTAVCCVCHVLTHAPVPVRCDGEVTLYSCPGDVLTLTPGITPEEIAHSM